MTICHACYDSEAPQQSPHADHGNGAHRVTQNGATHQMPPTPEIAELTIFRRILYGLLSGIYGLGAALWFVFLPRGFPVGHSRF